MLRQLAARLCGGEGQHVYRYATAWPVEMLLAQSWDTALLEEVGAAVATSWSSSASRCCWPRP